MNDLESRVAASLHAQRAMVGPPPAGLAERVHRGVRRRRALHRAGIGAASLAVISLGAVAVLTVAGHRTPPTDPANGSATTTASPQPPLGQEVTSKSVPLPEDLAKLLPGAEAEAFALGGDSGGRGFRGVSLSDDGTVVGVDSLTYGWTATRSLMAATGCVADTEPARPETLTLSRTPAGDSSSLAWVDGDLQTRCRNLQTGSEEQLGGPAIVSRGYLVWTDGAGDPDNPVVVTSAGCEQGHSTGARGLLVGFEYPIVYLREADGQLTAYDVRRTDGTAVAGADAPPAGADPPAAADTVVAAGAGIAVWASGDQITVTDASGAKTQAFNSPAGTNGSQVGISIGRRFVAVAGVPIDGSWSRSRSVIYDRQSGTWVSLPGAAWAAGDWLAWQDGPVVYVVNVADAS